MNSASDGAMLIEPLRQLSASVLPNPVQHYARDQVRDPCRPGNGSDASAACTAEPR